MIMFATDANIKLLCEAQTIYVDGTFQTCSSLFYQVFIIHAFKNGRQFPLVYALLPNKSRATYVKAFDLVKQKAHSFEPQITLSDVELAIKQAVELSFPTTDFRGCYYHFSQALMRKFQNIGLQVAYREHSMIPSKNSCISICGSLPCATSLANYQSCCPTVAPHPGVHPIL